MDQFFQGLWDSNPNAMFSQEADLYHRDIERLLPLVVADSETDQMTEAAESKLTRLMARSTRSNRDLRDFFLSLRSDIQICEEHDPITYARIPELLRCTIEDEDMGHKYCFNLLSLLDVIAQPWRDMIRRGEGIGQLMQREDIQYRNPLTNLPLTDLQIKKIIKTASNVYFLLEFLS